MVARLTLDQLIKVRVLVSQPGRKARPPLLHKLVRCVESGPRSFLLPEWSAVSFLLDHKELQGAITETRYYSVICKNQRGTRPMQFKGVLHAMPRFEEKSRKHGTFP
jgi:hypothetical protein